MFRLEKHINTAIKLLMGGVLILGSLVALPISANAQEPFGAEAGQDKHFCQEGIVDSMDNILGGSPSAVGGYPPYNYRWYLQEPVTYLSSTRYASDILNDTTISNPTIDHPYSYATWGKAVKIFLEVTDSMGQTSTDSMIYTRAKYAIGLTQLTVFPESGDTFQLWPAYFSSAYPIVEYNWLDPVGFIDPPNTQYPRIICNDSTPTTYDVELVDSFNCRLTIPSLHAFHVLKVGIETKSLNAFKFPNPSKLGVPIALPEKVKIVSVTNIYGSMVKYQPQANEIIFHQTGTHVITLIKNNQLFSYSIIILP